MSEIPAPAELVAEWRALGELDPEGHPFRVGYRAALRKCADELELSLGIQAVRAAALRPEGHLMPILTWEGPADQMPNFCPEGCGGVTEDPYGGPCKACWRAVDDRRRTDDRDEDA